MKPNYILLLFALIAYHSGYAQLTFKYGPEIGATVSLFPPKTNYTLTRAHSPLIGFTTETTFGKHLQLTLGAQYQKAEEQGYWQDNGYDISKKADYVQDIWDKQVFHKLCFPINLGYALHIWKFQPSVFLGYRLNYYLAGNYYKKYILHYDINVNDETDEYQFNPVNPDQTQSPLKRYNNQLLLGFACGIGQHIKLTASSNFGNLISYSSLKQNDSQIFFRNTDYIVSLIYFFKPLIN